MTAEHSNYELMVNNQRRQLGILTLEKEQASRNHELTMATIKKELTELQRFAGEHQDANSKAESQYEAAKKLKETLIL
jgi:hypothetical protein